MKQKIREAIWSTAKALAVLVVFLVLYALYLLHSMGAESFRRGLLAKYTASSFAFLLIMSVIIFATAALKRD